MYEAYAYSKGTAEELSPTRYVLSVLARVCDNIHRGQRV